MVILDCHILGYEFSVTIHEAIVAILSGTDPVEDITGVMHTHPTYNKAVKYAFKDAPL